MLLITCSSLPATSLASQHRRIGPNHRQANPTFPNLTPSHPHLRQCNHVQARQHLPHGGFALIYVHALTSSSPQPPVVSSIGRALLPAAAIGVVPASRGARGAVASGAAAPAAAPAACAIARAGRRAAAWRAPAACRRRPAAVAAAAAACAVACSNQTHDMLLRCLPQRPLQHSKDS